MMLAGCGGLGDRSGQPMRVRGEVRAADAHDAGQVWGVEEQSGQQMFMMVCVLGWSIGEEFGQRMLSWQVMVMVMAGFGALGESQGS